MTVESFDARASIKGRFRVGTLSESSWGAWQEANSIGGWSGSMDSINHPRPYLIGGPWTMNKTLTSPAIVSGKYKAGLTYEYDSYPISAPSSTSPAPVRTNTSIAELLARSNPSRPHVSLPNFFFELGDIPKLIKDRGTSLSKKAAKGHLNLEFGWNLLFGDLLKLNMFGKAVDRRIDHLSRMYRNGGTRFKADGGWNEVHSSEVKQSLTPYELIRHHHGTAHVWYSYSWIPIVDLRASIPTYGELYWPVFRSALGLYPNIGILWDALPWSWLIDWFTNTGSVLWSMANNLGFIPGQCYQMTQTEAITIEEIFARANFTGNIKPAQYRRIVKSRTPVLPGSLSANVPILSGKQIGILGSLAVSRLR